MFLITFINIQAPIWRTQKVREVKKRFESKARPTPTPHGAPFSNVQKGNNNVAQNGYGNLVKINKRHERRRPKFAVTVPTQTQHYPAGAEIITSKQFRDIFVTAIDTMTEELISNVLGNPQTTIKLNVYNNVLQDRMQLNQKNGIAGHGNDILDFGACIEILEAG